MSKLKLFLFSARERAFRYRGIEKEDQMILFCCRESAGDVITVLASETLIRPGSSPALTVGFEFIQELPNRVGSNAHEGKCSSEHLACQIAPKEGTRPVSPILN